MPEEAQLGVVAQDVVAKPLLDREAVEELWILAVSRQVLVREQVDVELHPDRLVSPRDFSEEAARVIDVELVRVQDAPPVGGRCPRRIVTQDFVSNGIVKGARILLERNDGRQL